VTLGTPFRAEVFLLVRGLYTAASGALVAQSMADNVANNLANVNTSGFKQTLLQVVSAPTLDVYRIQTDPGRTPGSAVPGMSVAPYVGSLGTGSRVYDTPNSFEQGALQSTGNQFDVALSGAQGNGFFAVQTPQGVRYTRDGQFLRDGNGYLTTQDGNFVLSQRGQPIVLQDRGAVNIGADGSIVQGNRQVDTLQIVRFNNLTQVRPEGDNLFAPSAQAGIAAAQGVAVQQGFLEKSNANVVRSMVDLINAERWFDANEKAITTQDNATSLAIAQLAKTQGA
jgi:flagellar basal-body rod protein FlgG